MKIDFSVNKVTPLSKSLALLMVGALPFIGFWLGTKYSFQADTSQSMVQESNESSANYYQYVIPDTNVVLTLSETIQKPKIQPAGPLCSSDGCSEPLKYYSSSGQANFTIEVYDKDDFNNSIWSHGIQLNDGELNILGESDAYKKVAGDLIYGEYTSNEKGPYYFGLIYLKGNNVIALSAGPETIKDNIYLFSGVELE